MTNLSGANLNNGAAVGPQGEGRDSPSRFPKYPAYKDSGVEWLGEVPEHWVMGSLKNMAQIRNGRDYKEVESSDGEYPVIGSGGQFSNATQYLYEGESVLLGRKGTIDKPLYINGRFWTVDTMFYTEISKGACAKFFYYNSLTIPFGYYSTSTALPSMTQADLLNHPVAIPTKLEQTQIARFLDHETARIDALIEEQQCLIELLKEKRQAVISHAVTKGLDPTAPMKDSGVEWLGEVPAHWDVVSLKRVVVFQRGHDLPSESREEGNVPVISSGGYSGTHSVACAKAPGIVTGRYGSIGQFTLATEDYWPLNTALYSIELYGNKPRYAWYLLQGYAEHFLLNSLKSAVPGVDRNDIHVVKVVVAPVEEQDQIVIYIDRISNQLDQLVGAAEKNVTLLQERRSALISAAVTGKIDVRGWQPPASTQAPKLAVAEAH